MKEIEIQLGKKLRLHHVFMKELNEKEVSTLPKSIEMFDSYIKSMGLKTKGPLITKSQNIVEDEIIKTKVTLLIQLENIPHNKLEKEYKYEDEVLIGKSLYARYIGDKEHTIIAQYKIQVVAYENELKLKGDIYNVFVSNDKGILTIDVFAPIYE